MARLRPLCFLTTPLLLHLVLSKFAGLAHIDVIDEAHGAFHWDHLFDLLALLVLFEKLHHYRVAGVFLPQRLYTLLCVGWTILEAPFDEGRHSLFLAIFTHSNVTFMY